MKHRSGCTVCTVNDPQCCHRSGSNTGACARSFNSTRYFFSKIDSRQNKTQRRPRFDFLWLLNHNGDNRQSCIGIRPKQKGGTAYLATQSTFLAIATPLALIRVYVKSIVVKKFGLDDAVIVSLVSTLVTNTNRKLSETRCKHHGADRAYVHGLSPRGHVTLSSPSEDEVREKRHKPG